MENQAQIRFSIKSLLFLLVLHCSIGQDINDEKTTAIIGENATLVCDTTSELVVWTLDGKNLTKTSNKRISWIVTQVDTTRPDGKAFHQVLTIQKVEAKDAGNYSCSDGENHQHFYVQPILEPKIIKKSPSAMQVSIGQDVTIFCYIELFPVDEYRHGIHWHREDVDGKEYSGDATTNLSNKTQITTINQTHLNVTLELKSVAKRDNGTYLCNIVNPRDGITMSKATSVLVLDVPQVRIDFVKAVGMDKIFMNWTINDGNSNVTHYRLQYLVEGNSTFTYYNNKINGNATSHMIRGLIPNTNYKLKLQAINKIGDGSPYLYNEFIKTLDKDPDFVPVIEVKGSSHTTITIGWQPPAQHELDYIHYYELIVKRTGDDPASEMEEAIHPQNSRNLPYMFDNLKSATEYHFMVRACSDLTKFCGNWSVPVTGTTMDGAPSKPLNLKVTCAYANISSRSSVEISWDPPETPNGIINVYQTVLTGMAAYRTGNNQYRNDTFGPKSKYEEKVGKTVYDSVPANTNYTVKVWAITRNKQRPGEMAEAHCRMPPTVPDNLGKFLWGRVKNGNNWIFGLNMPKISERNGPICCYLVYIVRLPSNQQNQLNPDKIEVMTHQQVHDPNNTKGGAYIAEVIDGDNFVPKVFLGDGRKRLAGNEAPEGERFGHAINDLDIFRKCLLVNGGKYHWSKRKGYKILTTTTKATKLPLVNDDELPDDEAGNEGVSETTTTAKPTSRRRRKRRQHSEPGQKLGTDLLSYEIDDGPLDENSEYTGFVEVIVKTENGDGIMNTFSEYFEHLSPGEPQNTSDSLENMNYILAFVVQILFALIVIVVLLLVSLCLIHRYHAKKIARLNGMGHDDEVISLRDSLRALCGGRSANNHHRHLIGTASSKPPDIAPILRPEMQQAYATRHKDSDYGFQQEFEMLPGQFNDRTTKNSDAKENSSKNRYPDIKSYDQTRVKLSAVNGCLSGSDYINANFVIGYKERKKFICAQGPMEGTVNDFWRMIWEQHLEIIVMLTNLEEYNKTKCAKYWPEKIGDSQQFGDISVKFVNEDRLSDYMIRELKIVKRNSHNLTNGGENGSLMNNGGDSNSETESRYITQYHYLVWKDFMAPEHPQGITKFVKQINSVYSVQRGPILVHCSAGVGRTGTLVALDSLLQQLEEENQVTIFNTVCDLRHQRNFLVQSLKQYIFLYRALMEVAVFGDTEILARNLSVTVESLKQKPSEEETAQCPLEMQFEKAKSAIDDQQMPKKTTTIGSSPENSVKNRDDTLLPYDRNRVILTPIPGRDNTTYINASFIEGNDHTETFIITQDPLPDLTIGDFWRMISEQSISTLVMISEIGEGSKKCPRYWADDEIQYDHILVKYIQSESCPYYTRREFKVTNCKIDDTLQVTQFQYNGWPTVEGEVPEVCRGIIELVDQATKHHANVQRLYTNAGPIAVHCNIGSDRSSIFVAMCFLVQQLRIEKKVDICSIVRKLRSQRLCMIDTYAQYEFLHRAIVSYADLHKLSTDSPPPPSSD